MRYFIDTHVHVYHCYDPDRFLERVTRNVSGTDVIPVLCLTESAGFDYYRVLLDYADKCEPVAGWSVHCLEAQPAVTLTKNNRKIIVIAGRQVISDERLEIIALFSDQDYRDGQQTQAVIDQIVDHGAIAILPWGVGKWLGTRGKIISRLLSSNDPDRLAIADISSRPSAWPAPVQFSQADELGYSCLYGTDPLPLDYEQDRMGSAGVIMDLADNPDIGVSELKTHLLKSPLERYGHRISALQFMKDQLMLRKNGRSCMEKQNSGAVQE
jgi:hypothetical protein